MILIGRLPRRLNGSSTRKEKLLDNFRESKFTIIMKILKKVFIVLTHEKY